MSQHRIAVQHSIDYCHMPSRETREHVCAVVRSAHKPDYLVISRILICKAITESTVVSDRSPAWADEFVFGVICTAVV